HIDTHNNSYKSEGFLPILNRFPHQTQHPHQNISYSNHNKSSLTILQLMPRHFAYAYEYHAQIQQTSFDGTLYRGNIPRNDLIYITFFFHLVDEFTYYQLTKPHLQFELLLQKKKNNSHIQKVEKFLVCNYAQSDLIHGLK